MLKTSRQQSKEAIVQTPHQLEQILGFENNLFNDLCFSQYFHSCIYLCDSFWLEISIHVFCFRSTTVRTTRYADRTLHPIIIHN